MMTVKKIIPLALLYNLAYTICPGQNQHPLMTLDNAIAIGLKNNYDILMAKNQAAVSANDYSFAFGAFLPTINGLASKSWAVNNVNQKFLSGSSINKKNAISSNTNLSVNLNWTLFDGLKVFAAAHQLAAIKSEGELDVKNQVNNSVAAIIDAYYNIVQQKQNLLSLQQLMDISRQKLDIATRQFNVGSGAKLAMLQAEVDLDSQKSAYLQQQYMLDQDKSALNQLIALPAVNTDYDVVDTIPVDLGMGYDALKVEIFNSNIPLQVQQKNIDISRYLLQEDEAARYPTISFDPSYSYSLSQTAAGFALYSQNRGFTYGFTATIPIFNQFNNTRLVRDARLNIVYQQLSLSNQQSQLDLSLQTAFNNYDYYHKALLLDEQTYSVAQESAQIALATFQQAQSTLIDVQIAQQSLQAASNKLIADRYNLKVAETTLLQLRGSLVK